jgi:hypothetical protein
VPDLRGLFLRGTGGSAASLGLIQQDAGRNATGTFVAVNDNWIIPQYVGYDVATGVFSQEIFPDGSEQGGEALNALMTFDLSRAYGAIHTANEFRPLNTAVRYLIRALP